jgi:hypothetical protein
VAFETVYLVSKTLDRATPQAVAAAEGALGIHFPAGYRAYVTALGAGDYNDDIRIMLPDQILATYTEQQQTWMDYADLYEGYYAVIPPRSPGASDYLRDDQRRPGHHLPP